MNNYNSALDLQKQEANSAGNALKMYNENYGESTQARINDFTNAIQKMWTKALSSDVINGVIKFGTNIINLVDDFGLLQTAVPILAGILTGALLSSLITVEAGVNGLTLSFSALNVVSGGLPLLVGAIVTALGFGVASIVNTTNAANELNNEFKQINDTYQQAIKSADDAKNSTMGQAKEAESLANVIETLNSKESLNKQEKLELAEAVKQLNSLLPDLNAQIDSQTGKLTTNTSAIESNITALKNKAVAVAFQAKAQADANAYASQQDLIDKDQVKLDKIKQQLSSFDVVYQRYEDIRESFNKGEIDNTEEINQIEKLSQEYGVDLTAKNATLAQYLDLQDTSESYQQTLDKENAKLKEYDSNLSNHQQKATEYSNQETIANQKSVSSFSDAESQKQLSSNSFLQTLYKNNQSVYQNLKSVYGTDVDNFKDFNQLKSAANALLIKELGDQWSQYYSTQEAALQAVVNMGSSDYSASQESEIVQAFRQGDIDESTEKQLLSKSKITSGMNMNAAKSAQTLLDAYSAASSQLSKLQSNSSGSNLDTGESEGSYTPSGSSDSSKNSISSALTAWYTDFNHQVAMGQYNTAQQIWMLQNGAKQFVSTKEDQYKVDEDIYKLQQQYTEEQKKQIVNQDQESDGLTAWYKEYQHMINTGELNAVDGQSTTDRQLFMLNTAKSLVKTKADEYKLEEDIYNLQKKELEDKLSALQKEHDLQQSIDQRAELQTKVDEAKTTYTNTINEKDVKLLQNGVWTNVADSTKVASAAKDLKDAQKALSDFDMDAVYKKQQEAIQSQIDSLVGSKVEVHHSGTESNVVGGSSANSDTQRYLKLMNLKPNETFSILQNGETVATQMQMSNLVNNTLPSLLNGSIMTNAINRSSSTTDQSRIYHIDYMQVVAPDTVSFAKDINLQLES